MSGGGAAMVRRLADRRRFFALFALVAVVATGLALALFHRPWGRHFWVGTHPGRVGMYVAMTAVLAWVHIVVAYLGVAGLVIAARGWRHKQGIRWGGVSNVRACIGVAAATIAVTLVTGLAVPWQDTLPWSDRSVLRPALLDGNEGPFPELVGVAARYDTGRAHGTRVTVLALAHAGAPIVGGVLILVCGWRRKQGPAPD